MKFSSQLPTAIIATTIAVISPQVTVALTAVEVNNIASQVTVRISGPKPGGTGVIVKKQGNTYTVVTNWHVVDTAGTYTIQTQDGKRYQVNSKKMRRLPGVDLAILQFNSNQTYQPAKIADSKQIKEGTTVHAAGWMTPSRSCQESRCYNFSTGVINRILNSAKDGYGWVYSNEIRPGMSGGPVLDEEGRLVGINGRAITSPGSPGTDYLAIPINTVVKLVPGITFPQILTSPSPPQASENGRISKPDSEEIPSNTSPSTAIALTSNKVYGSWSTDEKLELYYSFTSAPGRLKVTLDTMGNSPGCQTVSVKILNKENFKSYGRLFKLACTARGVPTVKNIRIPVRQDLLMQVTVESVSRVYSGNYTITLGSTFEAQASLTNKN